MKLSAWMDTSRFEWVNFSCNIIMFMTFLPLNCAAFRTRSIQERQHRYVRLTVSHSRILSVFLSFTLDWSWLCNHGNTSSITWAVSTCTQKHHSWSTQKTTDTTLVCECVCVYWLVPRSLAAFPRIHSILSPAGRAGGLVCTPRSHRMNDTTGLQEAGTQLRFRRWKSGSSCPVMLKGTSASHYKMFGQFESGQRRVLKVRSKSHRGFICSTVTGNRVKAHRLGLEPVSPGSICTWSSAPPLSRPGAN